MSADARVRVYPMEAVRQRERWNLESLQSRLAAATVDQAAAADRDRRLRHAFRAAATAASVTAGAVIEADRAGHRLRYLAELQRVADRIAHVLRALDAAREHLLEAIKVQNGRLESIERHRRDFHRQAAQEVVRLDSIESERQWLARSAWMKRNEDASEHSVFSLSPDREHRQ